MTDDIRALTAELAQEPGSLVFLALAEALRKRGQLDAALTVAERGVARYPELADGHDLVAKIRADRGEGDAAFDSWTTVLKLVPGHVGAHKGLAFLSFRARDLTRSLMHLSQALEAAPSDSGLIATIARVRETLALESVPAPAPPVELPSTRSGPDRGPLLLLDVQGRVLRGQAASPAGTDVSDGVAATLAGISREVERVVRLLSLGEWRAVAVEGGPANYEIRAPTPETILLAYRGREVPAGQLSRIAERGAVDARRWLETIE